jgi:hypothetical protein
MSWISFHTLIVNGNRSVKDWNSAILANPNDPASALKVALLTVFDEKDMHGLENFCNALAAMLTDKTGLAETESAVVTPLVVTGAAEFDRQAETHTRTQKGSEQ